MACILLFQIQKQIFIFYNAYSLHTLQNLPCNISLISKIDFPKNSSVSHTPTIPKQEFYTIYFHVKFFFVLRSPMKGYTLSRTRQLCEYTVIITLYYDLHEDMQLKTVIIFHH